MHIREARGYCYNMILRLRICGDDVFKNIKIRTIENKPFMGACVPYILARSSMTGAAVLKTGSTIARASQSSLDLSPPDPLQPRQYRIKYYRSFVSASTTKRTINVKL